jgi:type I restriction enzyme S subunit
MNRTQLLQNFDALAETPDAVEKLRTLVLELATRGSLVPQEPNDELASEILRRIEQKQKRKHNDTPEALRKEFPLVLPNGWALARNRTLFTLRKGKMPKTLFTENTGLPYLDIAALEKGLFRRFTNDLNCPQVDENSLVIVCDGSRSGLVLEGKRGVLGSTISAIDFTELDKNFLKILLQAAYEHLNANKKGAAIPHLDSATLLQSVSAIPPLTEQRRIVAKVEELLALCDELAAAQTAAREHRTRLVRSALNHLTTTQTEPEFRQRAAFVLQHSDLVLDSVSDLRQAIYSLAVQGKLIPQDPNDEPTETILKRIAEERHSKSEGGSSDVFEPIGPVEERENPFPLPPAWQWVRLGDIATIKHGFAFSSESFTSEPTQFVLTTPGNFYEKGGFRDRGSKTKYYDGKVDPGFIFKSRDLIIPMTEQAVGLLGSPAFIPDDGKSYLHNQRLGKLSFYSKSIAPEFVFWFFNCAFFRNELARTCTGMKVRHTSPKRILGVPFPLCSLAEQQRIVAKVDELMRWCDALESRLTAAQTTATTLLDATLHQILTA